MSRHFGLQRPLEKPEKIFEIEEFIKNKEIESDGYDIVSLREIYTNDVRELINIVKELKQVSIENGICFYLEQQLSKRNGSLSEKEKEKLRKEAIHHTKSFIKKRLEK